MAFKTYVPNPVNGWTYISFGYANPLFDLYKKFSNPSKFLKIPFIVFNTFFASPAWDTPLVCAISHCTSNKPSSVIIWYPFSVKIPPSYAPYGGINVVAINASYFAL